MKLATPRWWYRREGAPAPLVRALLRPASWVWAAATARRIARARPFDPGVPVISVGNLTVGGSGKTPVAREVLRLLAAQGVDAHALSRGYGGRLAGPAPVDPGRHTAREVGDEPLMLARDAPVWVARDRAAGARAAVAAGAQALVLDDAHQNTALKKTLSLVVVDGETRGGEWPFGDGAVFPSGPMREPLAAGLARADAVVVLSPADLPAPHPELLALFGDTPVLVARLQPLAPPLEGPQVGFAGIAKPWRFEASLRAAGVELADFASFPDHAPFTARDLAFLRGRAVLYGAGLVTTEKDWVRLPAALRPQVAPWPVRAVFENEAALRTLLGIPAPAAAPIAASIVSAGAMVMDYEVLDHYPQAIRRTTPALSLRPWGGPSEAILTVFETGPILVSTCYLPIDLTKNFLFANQTYEGVIQHWNPVPRLLGDRYELDVTDYVVISRRAVLIGGPIDGNYYHWVLNWLSRLATLKSLAPDIYHDEDVAILMDEAVQASPYADCIRASGVAWSRIIWTRRTTNYLVEHAVLVSFGNQHAVQPEMVAELRDMLDALGANRTGRRRRLWVSRQALGPHRRRIANIDDVEPVLAKHGFEPVVLERLSLDDQVSLFREAEAIVGVHGAGFTNIIFCPPDCRIVVIESDLNIRLKVSNFYSVLSQACGLRYARLKAKRAPAPPGAAHAYHIAHNQDLIVDAQALDALLNDVLSR